MIIMPNFVYHYTSLQALLGIIQSHKLEFHGSRYDTMNDPTDCTFASEFVMPKIMTALEGSDLSDKQKEFVEMFPYIVSFSEKKDDDLMWRHYGSQVCLELDSKIVRNEIECLCGKGEFIYYNKCEYCNDLNVDEAFELLVNRLKDFSTDNVPTDAQIAMAFIKRDAFKREEEWRIIWLDAMGLIASGMNNGNCNIFDCEIPNGVSSYIRGNDIVLYKKFYLPAKALKGIILT